MSKILSMNLYISINDNNDSNGEKEYNIRVLNNINNKEFKFSLSDDTTDDLKKFIDHLLENVNKYDKLEINFDDNQNKEIISILGNNFKEIWENEFKSIKDEIDSL